MSETFDPETIRELIAALRLAQRALNTTPRFQVGDTDSYQIAATVDVQTNLLDEPVMLKAMGGSDFSFADLKAPKGCTVYLVLPVNQLVTFNRWLRLMVQIALQEFVDAPGIPSPRTVFLLDEFANLGRLSSIEQAVTLQAGYGLSVWMIVQDLPQLTREYREGWQSLVVYASTLHKTETDEGTGEEVERDIPFMKGYTVFNVEQIDGLPDHFYAPAAPVLDPLQRIETAETFFQGIGADIRHGGNRAFYAIGPDYVQMPPFETFKDPESYYATLAHELTHWTRHETRLNRDFGRKQWGDAGYAREELVAELGSAFLAADLGLYLEPRADHAAYLESWLSVLKEDKRAIFQAAAHAQRAADYLHRCQPQPAQQAA